MSDESGTDIRVHGAESQRCHGGGERNEGDSL
jgi:hypothetical protein